MAIKFQKYLFQSNILNPIKKIKIFYLTSFSPIWKNSGISLDRTVLTWYKTDIGCKCLFLTFWISKTYICYEYQGCIIIKPWQKHDMLFYRHI